MNTSSRTWDRERGRLERAYPDFAAFDAAFGVGKEMLTA